MEMHSSSEIVDKSENAHVCDDLCHLAKISLKHAYNMKKAEAQSYWRRCVFFIALASVITLFFGIVFFNTPTLITYLIEMVLCVIGITISCAWYKITTNNNQWHKNWYKNVKQLEHQIRECSNKPVSLLYELKEQNQRNSMFLYKSLNILFFAFWCVLPLISLIKFFYYFVYVNGIALSLMNTLFLCIPFLIMVLLSITMNVFMCMFSSQGDAEVDNNELDISLQYKNK
ncbi:MAG: hypothetical protein LBN41_11780 [Enterobacteriaceae bacterium]|jgi:uncharacterized membrane protein HdeD (DUF308 family)|nr:hypothetical protein [Enterobacteriaceae bacterium]